MPRHTLIFVTLLLFTLLAGCSEFGNNKEGGAPSINPTTMNGASASSINYKTLSKSILMHQFIPQVKAFVSSAYDFARATKKECEASQSTGAAHLEPLQRKWQSLNLSFHRLDIWTEPLIDSGWKDKLSLIHQFSSCAFDKQLAEKGGLSKDMSVPGGTLRGIEYLLFSQGQSCSVDDEPQMESFYQKEKSELQKTKCEALTALSHQVKQEASQLREKWLLPAAEKNLDQVTGPLVNAFPQFFFDTFFSLETVKDVRLGKPLGLSKDCFSAQKKCPDSVDWQESQQGLAVLFAQLEVLKHLFLGDESGIEGLGAPLVQKGKADVLMKMNQSFTRALTTLSALQTGENQDLKALIEQMDVKACQRTTMVTREVSICAVYQDLRELVLIFRSDVLLALSGQIPIQHQGDAD